jgi:ABC-type lipoprotein export system ATPase subunit
MPDGNSIKPGLVRVALDLHVHTPASDDWREATATPEQIVSQAISRGLDGIAVTDHQTGEWVDRMRQAAEGTTLAIIPGVEINNLAGNEGIHLITLFACDTTAQDIDRFLAAIGALTGTGAARKRQTATKGIIEVLNEVAKFGGIAVLAHCQSSKGSLAEMRGAVREELVRHPAVLAAEAPAEEYFDEGKRSSHKRTFDLLDGTDAHYKRQLAVYQASDNPVAEGHGHGLHGIGSRFTYFYLERPISLEGIRQCFIDRDARIEYPALDVASPASRDATAPRITHVKVTGGFLDGLDLAVHAGLTTILGSKGSGKSVLIELIRFVLDQEPTQPDLADDHKTKLEKQLGVYGRVAVTICDASGTSHEIVRDYDPAEGNPYQDVTFDPAEFFPCHFLSQNEIVRLAESEAEQIRFIDSFFDFHTFQRNITAIRESLAELDHQVADQIVARKRVQTLEAQRRSLAAQVAEKDRGLQSAVFAKFQDAQQKKQALDLAVSSVDGLIEAVKVGRGAIEAAPLPDAPTPALATDQLVRQLHEKASAAHSKALDQAIQILDSLEHARDEMVTARDQWLPNYETVRDEYNTQVKQIGGDAPVLSQDRARLVAALEKIDQELLTRRQQAERLRPTVEQRYALLEQLDQRHADYTQARRDRCEWFDEKSEGQITASVSTGATNDEFREWLTDTKRGSYLSGTETDTIAASVTPREFIRCLLRYDLARAEKELQPICDSTKLGMDRIRKLADFLLEDPKYTDFLQMEYMAVASDRPEIRFRRDDGSYSPLRELSTGQKATVFLVMALCEGENPIVVDQPEDSLDIRSIWHDMCVRLRRSKRARQFLFTTHNSSLAVASDSDKYVVLQGDAHHGEIAMAGAIDGQEVRAHVIQLLEGGTDTYFLKQSKYDVHDPSHD